MLGSPEQDYFVSRGIIAMPTTVRRDGSPASSMVSYARRGDRVFFTTTLGAQAEIEQMISAPGRAVFELAPTRVSGVLLTLG
jgi:hypothetical protein